MNNIESVSEIICKRRSYRNFLPQLVEPDKLSKILQAALLSPTSRNRQDWQFIVVEDRVNLQKLSECKEHGAGFLKKAPIAIVVLGNSLENDCWVEDGSIAAFAMQLQAEALGLGSCWIHVRNRGLNSGITASEIVRGILNIPDDTDVLCILALGYPATELPPHSEDNLKWEQVHIGSYLGNE